MNANANAVSHTAPAVDASQLVHVVLYEAPLDHGFAAECRVFAHDQAAEAYAFAEQVSGRVGVERVRSNHPVSFGEMLDVVLYEAPLDHGFALATRLYGSDQTTAAYEFAASVNGRIGSQRVR